MEGWGKNSAAAGLLCARPGDALARPVRVPKGEWGNPGLPVSHWRACLCWGAAGIGTWGGVS